VQLAIRLRKMIRKPKTGLSYILIQVAFTLSDGGCLRRVDCRRHRGKRAVFNSLVLLFDVAGVGIRLA
jgi:hypothetical protein